MQRIINNMHYIYVKYNIQVVLSLSNICVLIKMWENRCNLKFIKKLWNKYELKQKMNKLKLMKKKIAQKT
jgi:hypothetical protein